MEALLVDLMDFEVVVSLAVEKGKLMAAVMEHAMVVGLVAQ